MKAVNLIPRESRRGSGSLSEVGIATTAIFAALAVGLALVVTYVFLANGITSRKDHLGRVQQQSSAAQKEVVALKPYADLEALRESLLDRVRSLAGGRYDWPTMISRLARALPADTTLTSLDGTPSDGGAGAGPSISLLGCTPSHRAVAGVIDRLRAVDGVSTVSLQSSTVSADSSAPSGSGGCPHAEQFKLTIALTAPATPAAAAAPAAGATPAAPTTTTPSPAPASPQAATGTATGGAS